MYITVKLSSCESIHRTVANDDRTMENCATSSTRVGLPLSVAYKNKNKSIFKVFRVQGLGF